MAVLVVLVWIVSCLCVGGLLFYLACFAENRNARERQTWHDRHKDDCD